jgi:hypothetical protein
MTTPDTVENWRGEQVLIARSPSGVVLLCDYAENLLRTHDVPWPPPALVSKLVADDRIALRWPTALRDAVGGRLGHYTPLQSINSEDAITWSFFGPLKYGDQATRAAFLRWLFGQLAMPAEDTVATIDLWRRIPHPQKPSAPGPELDVLIHGDRSVVFVEAKWGSPEGTGQGPTGTATQMQLRRDFLERYGCGIYGDRRFLVLGLVIADPIEATAPPDTTRVATRTLRWEELATFCEHPVYEQLAPYVAWKRRHSGR